MTHYVIKLNIEDLGLTNICVKVGALSLPDIGKRSEEIFPLQDAIFHVLCCEGFLQFGSGQTY